MRAILATCFSLLLMVVVSHEATAGTQSVTVDVGGQGLYLPAPAGFHEISLLSPETRKLAETLTPPSNRLLAVFVSESDLGRIMKGESPELQRYMFMQAYRQLEKSDISGAQFSKLVAQVKQQQYTLLEKSKDQVDSVIDRASGKISKDYGISLKVNIGEPVPLGVFMEKSDAVGFAMLAKCHGAAEGQQVDLLMAGGTSLVRVNGKILYAYVYSRYETQKDLDWVRATSSSWADQLLTAQVAQGTSTGAEHRSTSASGFGWDEVVEKAIGAGIVGGIAGLIIGAIKVTMMFLRKKQES